MTKILIIDVADMFNDMLFEFINSNAQLFLQVDDVLLYTGKLPLAADIVHDTAAYLDTLTNYIEIHLLIPTNARIKLVQHNVIVDAEKMYIQLMRAIKTICKSTFMAISLQYTEYATADKRKYIINDIKQSIGANNCDMYTCKHPRVIYIAPMPRKGNHL